MVYDTSKVLVDLNLEEILKRTTEYDIYAYYLGSKFDVGKIMSSPFRQDLKPSFGVFKSSTSSDLLWKDQATGETGNVVSFVKKLKGFYHSKQALKLIWSEVVNGKLNITKRGLSITEQYSNAKSVISIKRKNLTEVDDKYWSQYNIDRETLGRFNVYPISFFWINDVQQTLIYSKESPMYAYKIFNKFKVYRPYSSIKMDKWRTNCASIDLQGYEQLPDRGDLLIITKSLKDVMVLYKLGYNAVALQSEHDHLRKDIYEDLAKRFTKLLILFDNDKPGIEAAIKLSNQYNIPYVYIDTSHYELYKVKDISDYVANYGFDKAGDEIKQLINKI